MHCASIRGARPAARPPLRVVGNLPYNISTPLLFHLLRTPAAIPTCTSCCRRRSSNASCAAPGSEHYGRLDVMLAPWVAGRAPVRRRAPGAFRPPPRSGPRSRACGYGAQPTLPGRRPLRQVVAAAFSQRRKTLRNALRGLLRRRRDRAAGIDPGTRPETLESDAVRRACSGCCPAASVQRMAPTNDCCWWSTCSDDSLPSARRPAQLARSCSAPASTCCTSSNSCPVEPMGETLMPAVQIEEELLERARQRLGALAAELGLDGRELLVEAGNVKSRSSASRASADTDLIVIGSRERHGMSILVNLTEDTVLHGAPCDVLAVRVGAVAADARPSPPNAKTLTAAKDPDSLLIRIGIDVETTYLEQSEPQDQPLRVRLHDHDPQRGRGPRGC
jgi:universal stress protein A